MCEGPRVEQESVGAGGEQAEREGEGQARRQGPQPHPAGGAQGGGGREAAVRHYATVTFGLLGAQASTGFGEFNSKLVHLTIAVLTKRFVSYVLKYIKILSS